MAGRQLGLEDIRGQLLYHLLEVIKFYRPKHFMLENVKGIQSKKFKPVIDLIYSELESVGYDVFHKCLNSALVSAQNRERVYFTNVPLTEPEDEGIVIADILEDGFCNRDKSYCIDANYHKGGDANQYFNKSRRQLVFDKPIQINPSKECGGSQPSIQNRIYDVDGKCSTCNTFSVQKVGVIYTKNYIQMDFNGKGNKSQDQRCYFKEGKHGTLPSSSTSSKIKVLIAEDGTKIYYRNLTPLECERLQTIRKNFTNHVSKTRRLSMIGNGWTIKMIKHIYRHFYGGLK